jgi:membrane protein implicated in regulation of membrane protease activity
VFAAAVLSLVIGCGAAIGAVLHWLMPSLDFGLAIIIGLLSLIVSAYMVMVVVQSVVSMSSTDDHEEEDSEEEEEEQAELIANQVAERSYNRVDLPYPSGRRRRK